MIDRGAEFSVYQFFRNGDYEAVLRWVDCKTAILQVKALAESVAGAAGTTCRIIITDGGDYTVFEWKFGRGVVFPPNTDFIPPRH
jgi:hypothetical protein